MNETRSLGIQCQNRKHTAVQTKRLSKEELRYYTKIVEKEKQVLTQFMKATKEYPPIRQPHYKVNLFPTQTKFHKNHDGQRKKRKSKNGKRSSHKKKHVPRKTNENSNENAGHYAVSKIVVDDATRCLKLRVKSCNAKKSSSEGLKEKNAAVPAERTRSRKAKQPRRFNRSLGSESLEELETEDNRDSFKNAQSLSPKPNSELLTCLQGQALSPSNSRKTPSPEEITKPEGSGNTIENEDNVPSPSPSAGEAILPKDEVTHTDCSFANEKSHDHSRAEASPLPTMTSHHGQVLPPTQSDEDLPEREATSSDDDSNYHSVHEDSDDALSVCSEEFSIVEASDENVVGGNETTGRERKDESEESKNERNGEQADKNLKDELKKRLKANIIRKAVDIRRCVDDARGNKHDMPGNKQNNDESEALPQVVSVHFYDPQSHSERVVGADTHITQYPTYSTVRDFTLPSTSSSCHRVPSLSPSVQKPPSATLTSRPLPIPIPQATLPRIPPMTYPYPQYYGDPTHINKRPPYQIPHTLTPAVASPGVPTQVRPNPPETIDNSITNRGVSHVSVPTQVRSYHPETVANRMNVRGDAAPSDNVPTQVGSHHPELNTNTTTARRVPPINTSISTEEKDSSEADRQERKRKRFIFGAHEPPKKKVISSLLTPLCEREATRLADGIHEINMQYFPLRSLAQKAAKRVSGDTDDVLKLIEQKMQLKTKIQDVEKARNLLKDIYDMVLKSKEIEDIQNFELVSHNFGVRNILNHLSLVDLYFGELGSELHSKI